MTVEGDVKGQSDTACKGRTVKGTARKAQNTTTDPSAHRDPQLLHTDSSDDDLPDVMTQMTEARLSSTNSAITGNTPDEVDLFSL